VGAVVRVFTGTGGVSRPAGRLLVGLIAIVPFALFSGWTANALAHATSGLKAVRYRDLRMLVPRSWPVYELAADPTACVRFDRHAVYLGQPSAQQRCPAHAVGPTEAILVQPLAAHDARAGADRPALRLPTNPGALGQGSAARVAMPARGLVVTATWREDRGLVERALGIRELRAATASLAPVPRYRQHAVRARAASGMAGGAAVYTGLGFDACSAPSAAHMAAWASSPYRAIGIYLGGANLACAQPNLTPGWVAQEAAAGWHLIPTYVGLQAPRNECGCAGINPGRASAEGAAAADDAIEQAQSLGIGAGNPIYFDMENYARGGTNTSSVLAFLAAWTSQLRADGFRSGVYSNADSGMLDLIGRLGTGYPEPDDIWFADWNGKATASDPYIPAGDWSAGQRLHQYDGAHNETHGGVTINIDGDYLDGLTAGSSTSIATDVAPYPQLQVTPLANGRVSLRANWNGTSNVNAWQLLAGSSPQNLSPFGSAIKGTAAGITILLHSEFPYFAVQALGSGQQAVGNGEQGAGSGQQAAANGEPVVGTSPAVATPAHLAIYGPAAYVSPGGVGGLPTGCFAASFWCAISTEITAGRAVIARTGPELLSADGGLLMFRLSRAGRALLARAAGRRLLVHVMARDAGGPTVNSTLSLIPFATTGPSQAHSSSDPPALRIVGGTQFVSNGVVGGILTACSDDAPCLVRTKVTSAGATIASTGAETLGANELGYMIFRLTARGRTMLARARGNRLPARAALSDQSDTATANITLVSFR